MSKVIHQTRINEHGEFDNLGRIFVNPKNAKITDLSGVKFVHCGVDTVRQLYRGKIKDAVLGIFEDSAGIVTFSGYEWYASRVGRDSGYQFKLQNNDLGLIVLIKNFNVKDDVSGPHLKIDVSPHLIDSNEPAQLQAMLDKIANDVLEDVKTNQVAIHIALDVQGWLPPADTVARMQCRSRRVRDISGISSFDFAATASVYGNGETYMFGSANGLQLAIYNKTKQAKVTDKLDYWRSVWGRAYDDLDTPSYNPELDVWRIELRFHHSVVQQFADGSVNTETGELIKTSNFNELVPHLRGLWQYGFNVYKLLAEKAVYDPAWTMFCFDASIKMGAVCLLGDTNYKRYYKSAAGFSGKNIELFLGNFVSIIARNRVGATKAFEQLKRWDCWLIILEHFELKGLSERDVYFWLRDKLTERVLRYGVAV